MSGLQLSQDKLIEVYRSMRTIRRFEERVMDEMATGDIPGNTHLYAGQEASAVGICLQLREDDYISSTHRGHGHSIAKGVDIDSMMAEIFGRATGTCGGKGGSQHIADISKGMLGANGIVAAGAPITCGAALSAKLLGTGQVAVAFAGDGAMNEGVMSESFNLAKIWNLPIVFAIEDNGFGEATANEHVSAGSFTRRAESYDIPSIEVDGTDVFKVYEAAGEAVERARNGGGPTMLHIHVPRYYGHYSGDPDTYRTPEEKAAMRNNRDCLSIFRKHVKEVSLLDSAELDAVDEAVEAAIDHAVAAARAAPFPPLSALTTDVYVKYL
ncbi:thiamine pyrophosphate-dependent dehydrogenase E1 component subunit alpha [Rhizobium leguminosarum bv. viciae USDA 2370]|uniref:thiamine pyrophosphate-dependent dehydrogenase E1 component subunit alpha n=3 Tax=Rhizobium leguminosarum TaxID=384 RepID=UPI000B92688A|nr:thiamine pyrophosphate-dependent dehydrogenase E1 component subunit alpha [Rhizobium leguminosarum]ASS59035.1 ABC transporter substrate-binding protein [Rhizobium leguminosarum bv. viciae]MDX6006397.1 thiamine pyrophosphate-dependent dehydrogenase E1 component subunit alpha [Rhizobium leguminosarum]NKK18538.1 ABC transporter substrate-binding protein [Rhizobium leguminosarum bv. viciae]NKK32957.1 ABC transporter substrate-binding protein [Rhizobium leguminosarum bv. viciae]NKK40022.1 ABC tr